MKVKNALYEVLICPSRVPEMNSLKVTDKGLEIGAAVTLTDLGKKLEEIIHSMPGNLTLHLHIKLISALYFSLLYESICCNTGNAKVVCRSANKKHGSKCVLKECRYFSLCAYIHNYYRHWEVIFVMPVLYLTSTLC